MSHFVVLVQLPKTKNVDDALEHALAPFDENMSVDPYEVTCYCVKHKANVEADRRTTEKFGNINELRDMFAKLKATTRLRAAQARLQRAIMAADKKGDEKARDKGYADSQKIEAKLQASWAKFIHLSAREKFERKLRAELEPKMTPEPSCDECKGSGKHDSTYNPDSQWDWYTVGGRWSGYFAEDVDQVDGKTAKQVISSDKGKIPFALLSKDGKWHEKGAMGWFGMSANEKSDKSWTKEANGIIKSFDDDDVIVAVDCHI